MVYKDLGASGKTFLLESTSNLAYILRIFLIERYSNYFLFICANVDNISVRIQVHTINFSDLARN